MYTLYTLALPEDYESKDWKPPVDPPCIIKLLCEKHEGLEIEAKVIKEHWWKPHIRKLFEKKVGIHCVLFPFKTLSKLF